MKRTTIAIALLVSASAVAQTPATTVTQPVVATAIKPKAVPVPIPPMNLEIIPAAAPMVTSKGDLLRIDCENARLSDVLDQIRAKTHADIQMPEGKVDDRVFVHASGEPRAVISSLLDGTSFGYIMVPRGDDPDSLDRLIITRLNRTTKSDVVHSVQITSAKYQQRQAVEEPEQPAADEDTATTTAQTTTAPAQPDPAPAAMPVSVGAPSQPAIPIANLQPGTVLPPSDADKNANSSDSSTQASNAPEQKISPAAKFMQDLYKLRLQQNVQPPPPH